VVEWFNQADTLEMKLDAATSSAGQAIAAGRDPYCRDFQGCAPLKEV